MFYLQHAPQCVDLYIALKSSRGDIPGPPFCWGPDRWGEGRGGSSLCFVSTLPPDFMYSPQLQNSRNNPDRCAKKLFRFQLQYKKGPVVAIHSSTVTSHRKAKTAKK
jgi:hypothetical protein